MIINILYFVLAAFGLGFLIFIHELGHYFMAQRVGMKVEAFGIGFGKPIKTWVYKGVKWNLCWLPFGGYVRIAGMEKEGGVEPHLIKNGFFGKSPLDRIKVGIMGPLVNILFALLLFFMIWVTGGREKPFSEFTRLIGWIDPQSELYERQIRPGDQITTYGGRPFEGFRDLQYNALLSAKTISISGQEIDYRNFAKTPFQLTLNTYPDPRALNAAIKTIGVLNPARYLLYDHSIDAHGPMEGSGIEKNDRIVWVDGSFVFSMAQLADIVNANKALITLQRGDEILQTRLPRVKLSDIRYSSTAQEEMSDWQFESELKGEASSLYFIPYNLTYDAVVENLLPYMDDSSNEYVYKQPARDPFEMPLQQGDRIIAVDGQPITTAPELLFSIQQKKLHIIVQREATKQPLISWQQADDAFIHSFQWDEMQKMVATIGTATPLKASGSYHLLNPVQPKPFTNLSYYQERQEAYEKELLERKQRIDQMEDPAEKARAAQILAQSEGRLVLGFVPKEELVRYNPSPVQLFADVFDQIYRTIKSLVTGSLSPKWMSGPVGIVQVFHYGWSHGIREALYWMAVISLNLGLINLLPIPVLDGGHILFSLVEMVTKKPIKSKTMERVIIPFVILIIAGFIYFTYNDLMRIFSRFF